MQLLEIKELSSDSTSIKFHIHYPPDFPQTLLKVTVLEQIFNFSSNNPAEQMKLIKLCEILFERDEKAKKLPEKIMVEDLPSGKLFKFNFCLWDQEEDHKIESNVFSSTKGIDITTELGKENIKEQSVISLPSKLLKTKIMEPVGNIAGLCESENILSKYAQIQNIGIDTFSSEKDIAKNLLEARQTAGAINYIHSNYKFAKPKSMQQIRKKRALLIGYQSEMMEEIFGFQREYQNGKEFGNNDWFMGPFYSYQNNVHFQ